MTEMLRRGELHWASVPPAHGVGHEQHNTPGKPRCWLIVSDDRLATRGALVLACPLTTRGQNTPLPESFWLEITPDMVSSAPTDDGSVEASTLLVYQLRVMSVERFQPRPGAATTRLGKLKPSVMAQVEERLMNVLRLGTP